MEEQKATHPINAVLRAQGRSKAWLARQTRYHEGYVRAVLVGWNPAAPRFRRRCSEALGLPEEELFSDAVQPTKVRRVSRAAS